MSIGSSEARQPPVPVTQAAASAEVTLLRLSPVATLSPPSPLPPLGWLARSKKVWATAAMAEKRGLVMSGCASCSARTRETSSRVERGTLVLVTSTTNSGSCSIGAKARPPPTAEALPRGLVSCMPPPAHETALSRPDGVPCRMHSARYAQPLISSLASWFGATDSTAAASSNRATGAGRLFAASAATCSCTRSKAAARATLKAAEEPRPAPTGRPADRTLISSRPWMRDAPEAKSCGRSTTVRKSSGMSAALSASGASPRSAPSSWMAALSAERTNCQESGSSSAVAPRAVAERESTSRGMHTCTGPAVSRELLGRSCRVAFRMSVEPDVCAPAEAAALVPGSSATCTEMRMPERAAATAV
eukprot:scaffold3006_cov111-Isochrysis_galbana.AAC.8